MANGLTPLTELEAINEILATSAESPVSTLEENQVIDASLAMNTLRATSVEVQTIGWNFNTEEGVSITPDQNGEIILPRNVLKVDTSGESSSINAVQRGQRLYNKGDRTLKFTTPVTVDWVLGLDFEDLPSTARMFITIRAARKYQDRYFGDQATHSYTLQDEQIARAAMMEEEMDSADPNMLNDSQFSVRLKTRS
ncbi:putative tail tubular protein A [Mesorhizobium phage vB_MloP_Lo5R7ANS]|uniref:Putative tail tubular protein A n=1 Tax=Mesorhizobium phage vB_MloP_Lo5R7ANS TaxID=1527771 RepID=A0A076YQK3_9CAUD|nr:tail protein [Mesorhizobium phage vB_MloP_Lo5R7ANS]AIK68521.1 putative tail tubular protein A [Mesorhizobium phage vB_MloP_Lo5R7ANS]